MRDLLETLRKTLMDVGNFGLLLLLFMFIYVLIGVQFFANRFRFDEDGKAIGIGEEGYYDADIPRSNFDTLVNAFVTVFEVRGGGWAGGRAGGRRRYREMGRQGEGREGGGSRGSYSFWFQQPVCHLSFFRETVLSTAACAC